MPGTQPRHLWPGDPTGLLLRQPHGAVQDGVQQAAQGEPGTACRRDGWAGGVVWCSCVRRPRGGCALCTGGCPGPSPGACGRGSRLAFFCGSRQTPQLADGDMSPMWYSPRVRQGPRRRRWAPGRARRGPLEDLGADRQRRTRRRRSIERGSGTRVKRRFADRAEDSSPTERRRPRGRPTKTATTTSNGGGADDGHERRLTEGFLKGALLYPCVQARPAGEPKALRPY